MHDGSFPQSCAMFLLQAWMFPPAFSGPAVLSLSGETVSPGAVVTRR
jgi:hypothetical protein